MSKSHYLTLCCAAGALMARPRVMIHPFAFAALQHRPAQGLKKKLPCSPSTLCTGKPLLTQPHTHVGCPASNLRTMPAAARRHRGGQVHRPCDALASGPDKVERRHVVHAVRAALTGPFHLRCLHRHRRLESLPGCAQTLWIQNLGQAEPKELPRCPDSRTHTE